MDKKEYVLYVKGKAVSVSEEVYKAYWKITEHEKYLIKKDQKNNVIPFSALDYDGHFVDTIIDERIDLEKILGSHFLQTRKSKIDWQKRKSKLSINWKKEG